MLCRRDKSAELSKRLTSMHSEIWFRVLSKGTMQFSLLWFVLLALTVFSPEALAGQTTLRTMFHKSWSQQNGAPSSIQTLTAGQDGFIWLGTENGLYRFDGVHFERITFPPFVKEQAVQSVAQTPDLTLWVGLKPGGIVKIKGDDVRLFTAKDGLRPGNVLGLTSIENKIWFCSAYGPASVSGDGFQYYGPEDGLSGKDCDRVLRDLDGNIWIIASASLYVRPHGTNRFTLQRTWGVGYSACSPSQVSGIWCTGHDRGRLEHLVFRNGVLKTAILTGPSDMTDTAVTQDGYLYILTFGHGVIRVREQDALSRRRIDSEEDAFAATDGLTGGYASQVTADREGSIWVATVSGLHQFRQQRFHTLRISANDFPVPMSGSIGEENLIAEKRIIDLDTGKVLFPGLKRIPRSFYRSSDGSFWFDAPASVQHLRDGKLETLPLPTSQTSDRMLGITEDDEGHLFIAPRRSQTFAWIGKQWVPASTFGLPSERVVTAYRDPNGAAWFGFIDGRAARVKSGTTAVFDSDHGLDVGWVLAFGSAGNVVLAGGSTGVAFLENGRFYPLQLRDGSPLRGVTGIAQSASGSVWLNTSEGVIEITAAEFAAALANPTRKLAFEHYGYQDGIEGSTDTVAGRPSAWVGKNGKLYVVMSYIYETTDPDERISNPVVPTVFITAATDGTSRAQSTSKTFVSIAKPAMIELDYTATSLWDPEKVRFRYKLEGYDQQWMDAGNRRQAFYSHLPPGTYIFHVIACNNSGVWNDTGASLSIRVPPTFEQTLWFKVAVLLALSICIMALFLTRLEAAKRRVRERAQARAHERERIARDLHDTFFPGVEALLLHVHAAVSKLPKVSDVRVSVDDAFRQADAVMAQGRALVYGLRHEKDDADLERSLRLFIDTMAVDEAPRISVTREGVKQIVDPLASVEILAVAKEGIWNALRHADARNIRVMLAHQENCFVLCVEDDGRGIDPDVVAAGYRHGHFGMQGMRERAVKLKGTIEFTEIPTGGTKMRLRVPASVAYVSRMERLSEWLLKLLSDSGRRRV